MPILNGKTAFVTGASKGSGAGIALELASAGAAVAVNYASDASGADAVVRTIRDKGGQAIAVQGNVALPADVIRMLDQAAWLKGEIIHATGGL